MTTDIKTVQALVDEIAQAAFDEGVAHGKGAKNFCGSNGKVPALIDALIAQMQRDAVQPARRVTRVMAEPAQGQTIAEMRENISAEFHRLGDARLMWVNEGTYYCNQFDADLAAPHPEAQALDSARPVTAQEDRVLRNAALRSSTLVASGKLVDSQQQDDHAGSPAPSALPLFAVAVAQRKWEILQADGYRMQRIEFARSIDGQETRGIIDPWGRVLWKYGQAESSKAALSDDDARLSEDDLHARSWWCPTCKKDVPPEMVTKDGEHYLEAGGCGYAVRGELIEDQPKQPLSDEEIKAAAKQAGFLFHTIPEYAPIQHTLPEEFSERCFYRFARAILARAGITRKPLTDEEIMDICKETSMLMWDEVDGYSIRGFARAIEAAHGITPQAGKESGNAS